MTRPARVLLAWSSGKDSAFTLHVLRAQGVEVVSLLTTINEAFDRVAMHAVRLELLRAQAEAVGLPLIELRIPLWGRPTRALAEEMIALGQKAVLTCVDPRVAPRELAGRAFDKALLAELPASVDPCGERGEFHSFAWNGPAFRRPVPVRVGEIVERDGFVFADLVADPAADASWQGQDSRPDPVRRSA